MIRVLHIPILLSLSIAHVDVEVEQCPADGCPKRGRQGSAMLQMKRDSAMVETTESDSCANFCAHNSAAWEAKCKLKGCSACPECDAFTTTTVPLAPSRPPAYFGCHPDQSGMKSGRQESTAEGIAECFDRCKGAGHMFAGLGCYNHEKVKCFCYSYETGVSPIIPMSAGGNCYAASNLCAGATNPTAGYEIGSEHSVAMYGLMEAQDYVVDADYEPVATQPTQAGASAWRHLKGSCPAPAGTSFSTLLAGSSLLGHTVVVPAGSAYVVDQSVTVDGTVTVEAGATLAFADVADLTLSVGKLDVYGTVQLGTEGCPLQSSGVTITLTGSKAGEVLYGADRTTKKGIIVNEGAVLDMHGKPYTPTWSRLSSTAANGSSTIKLQDAVDWEVNQYVVLVTTRHGDIDDHENEVRKITAVSGSEITLESPLDHVHFGGAEYQGEVGLLSRSITVQGDEQSESESFGGHTLCMKGATCRISYVLGYRMGQMNVMGRYPFHFHKMGDVQQASYFRGLAVVHSYFRAYTIHGTSNVTLSSSVAYDVMGTAVYMEDGVEMDNLIEFNLIARVQAIKPLEDPNGGYEAIEDATDAAEQWIESVPDRIVPTDLTPACFYITNQRNRWVGNVASGGFAGFIFPATPYALGDSAQTAPDFQPVLEDTIEFDGNTAHSGGQYWKYGGCMYVGGILINPDSSNTSHYAYNFAKFPRTTATNKFDSIYRGKLHVSNAKFWGCKTGLLAWGAELDSRPLTTVDKTEFHDNLMGIQFFAHNWISNAVFTAQTANVDVWKGWYTPHTAFKAYDQFMQTLFVNITVRGYKGPSDVGFLMLVVTDLSRQEGFTGFGGIKALDTDEDHLIQIERGGYCGDVKDGSQATGSGSATSFMNMQDMDGSFTGFKGGGILGAADCPEYDGTVYRTKNWWLLDDEGCEVRYDHLPELIASGDETPSGFLACPRSSPKAWADQPRTVVGIFLKPYAPGVVYHWGHEDRRVELLYSKTDSSDYGTLGACCDVGWYMHLDEGNPAEMTIELTQMVWSGGLFFATRYPKGATITVERCRGLRQELVCQVAYQGADKKAILNDATGSTYFVDSSGVLFLRLVDETNKWFQAGDVHIVQNMVDDKPYYLVKSDKTGQTEVELPAEDWMAAA